MKLYVAESVFCFLLVGTRLVASDIPSDYTKIVCMMEPIDRISGQRPHPNISPAEKIRAMGYSLNWSGYVAATHLTRPSIHSVTAVSGSWIVPIVWPNTHNSYSAVWVGMDGYNNSMVEQIGTAHNWVKGAAQHYAWFELYPRDAYMLRGFPVYEGDVLSATINYRNNVFKMRLYNHTRKVFTIIPSSYTTSKTAQRLSAEWIVEAPYYNGILPLSNFGKIYLSRCKAKIKNVSGYINNRAWKYSPIEMITKNWAPKSIPSNLGSSGTFFATWKHQ